MTYDPDYFKQRYADNRAELLQKAKDRYWANTEAKSLYDKKRRAEKLVELKAVAKANRSKNRGTALALLQRARYRAARDGIPFDIELSDVVVPEFCPVLGERLTSISKQGGHHFSPSLDRIVGSLGYVKGNVVVISRLANSIKRDGNPDQVMKVALWYKTITS